jgi:hypothetical protein
LVKEKKMANPNIVNVTEIYGKTAVQDISTTPTDIVTNSSGSGKIYKVNSLIIANINGTATSTITASIYRGSVEYRIAYTIVVPNDATIVLISKDAMVYLEEGDSIRLTAGNNSYLTGVCSYEIIS